MSSGLKLTKLKLFFHPEEKGYPCTKEFQDDEFNSIYYTIRDSDYSYYGKKFKLVVYQIYYKHNYAIGAFGKFPMNKKLGYHEKDIEQVCILYEPLDMKPFKAFFSAHAQEGKWYNIYNECEYDVSSNILNVYVSKYSHSMYPTPKTRLRILGFANDLTSNKGKQLMAPLINDDSITYTPQLYEVLATPFKQLMYPFYIPLIDKMKEEEAKKRNQ